jgi:hypothetical protein
METTVSRMPLMEFSKMKFDTSGVSFEDCLKLIRVRRDECNDVLIKLFADLNQFLEDTAYVEQVMVLDPEDYATQFDPNGTKSLDEYRAELTKFGAIRDRVQSELKNSYQIGLFRLSSKSFKDNALSHLKSLISNLLTQVQNCTIEARIRRYRHGFESSARDTRRAL